MSGRLERTASSAVDSPVEFLVQNFQTLRVSDDRIGHSRRSSLSSDPSEQKTRMREYREMMHAKYHEETPTVEYQDRRSCLCVRLRCFNICQRVCARININCCGTMYVKTDPIGSRAEGTVQLVREAHILSPSRHQNQLTNAGFYLELYNEYGELLEDLFPVALQFLPPSQRGFWETWDPYSERPLKVKSAELLKEFLAEARKVLKKIRAEMMAAQMKDFYRRSPRSGRSPTELGVRDFTRARSYKRKGELASADFTRPLEEFQMRSLERYDPLHTAVLDVVDHVPVHTAVLDVVEHVPVVRPDAHVGERFSDDIQPADKPLAASMVSPDEDVIVPVERRSSSGSSEYLEPLEYVVGSPLPLDDDRPLRRGSYLEAMERASLDRKEVIVEVSDTRRVSFDRSRIIADLKKITNATDAEADEVAYEVLRKLSTICTRQEVWDALMEAALEYNIEIKDAVNGEVCEVITCSKFRDKIERAKRVTDLDTTTLADMMRDIKTAEETAERRSTSRGRRNRWRVLAQVASTRFRRTDESHQDV
ncbi:MAG: hypothetical protein S4CHLAM37_06990 [Chlamydiia bacterium]|nr:hypothetical protein [Chlamydiia bacterium]